MPEEVKIERGQVWRRKKDGRLVEVESAKNTGTEERPYYDVIWRTPTGVKPSRRGAAYEDYWLRDYELQSAPLTKTQDAK